MNISFLLCDNGEKLIDFHIAEHTFQYFTLCVVLQCITYLSWYIFSLLKSTCAVWYVEKNFSDKSNCTCSGELQRKIHYQTMKQMRKPVVTLKPTTKGKTNLTPIHRIKNFPTPRLSS